MTPDYRALACELTWIIRRAPVDVAAQAMEDTLRWVTMRTALEAMAILAPTAVRGRLPVGGN